MIILISENDIIEALDLALKLWKKNINKFNKQIGNLKFWCNDDKEKTLFFQLGEGYATIEERDLKTEKIGDIVQSIQYQLEQTDETNV